MDQHVRRGHALLSHRDDLERQALGVEPQASGLVLAEQQWLAVLRHDLRLRHDFLGGELVEHAVVVDDAILEDLDE